MIKRIIAWSLHNRFLVLAGAVALIVYGLFALRHIPLDALPNLSDVQVIVKADYAGQSPQVVQNQVTYPLTTVLLAVPGTSTVRGYSMFGESLVYVIFQGGTDLYTARNLVQQYLNQVQGKLPRGVTPTLGAPATGLGWVYEYALVDAGGHHDLGALTTLQNWFLRYQLEQIPGVATVATLGGMNREYQVDVRPSRLLAYGIPLARVADMVRAANGVTSGGVVDTGGGFSYLVQTSSHGYIHSRQDLRDIPLDRGQSGVPLRLGDVARIHMGPGLRYGVADLDGKGQVVGGVVIARTNANAMQVIRNVRARIRALQKSLPAGIRIVTTYDRSHLIRRTISTLRSKLVEECLVVALVCVVFLFRLRSALVAIVMLPVGILAAFAIMQAQGLGANIMSLGGIAIAIGAMVDGAVVMIENMHKHMESQGPGADPWRVALLAAEEVGPSLFFSLLIIAVSFVPIFSLHGEEGRLFRPLAFTKTYAMAMAAALSITLVPVLMGYLIRGRIIPEDRNLLNRWLHTAYEPLARWVLRHRVATLVVAAVLLLSALYPARRLGSEFMPPLYEGNLMYMPSTVLPNISVGEAAYLLQQTDKIIARFPEVKEVFGKAGRAGTSTDPAPLSMFETVIRLKPRADWPRGVTLSGLKKSLNQSVRTPALANDWTMPIAARVDMLSTGIRTPVGIKVYGPSLSGIQRLAIQIESAVKHVPGTRSVYAARIDQGRYIVAHVDRAAAARYGLSVTDVDRLVSTGIAGKTVTTTVQGYARYPVVLRYPRHLRQSLSALEDSLIVTPDGERIPLRAIARVARQNGPTEIDTQGGQMYDIVTIDTGNVSLAQYVAQARAAIARQVTIPPGYTVHWSGQYRFYQETLAQLMVIVPVMVFVIFLLLYLNFRRLGEPLIILLTLPFGLVGGIWFLYLLGYKLSLAVAVGFIAAAGVAAEFGVVLLLYLNQALTRRREEGRLRTWEDVRDAVIEGTTRRLRPINMTAMVVVAGLLPIFVSKGAGADVMKRIAAPFMGAMITAPALSLLVIPVVYALWQWRTLRSTKDSAHEHLLDLPASNERDQ
ncbi:MAG: CusA/CzcA family heavy metal efflux RND transporter [Pseudomonadota bacterium]|nr:CusA/CzcA family heavy metal efflux RND transporter [Pseudomonadota bacterium]